jgi:fructokinase
MPKPTSVLCFGEALWDVFPDGRRPGGAPLNVAYHLRQLGLAPRLISAVGRDEPGEALLRWIRRSKLDTRGVGRVDAPTGSVTVHAPPGGEPHYHILTPAAWDAIPLDDALGQWAFDARALVYGSLAARSPNNQRVLDFLLSLSGALKVMDVNLRPPHTRPGVVMNYAVRADVLKCNQQELALLSGQPLPPRAGKAALAAACATLAERVEVSRLVITRGAQGALGWDHGRVSTTAAPKIQVADPVGAGDAFTAALVRALLAEIPLAQALGEACARGAWVASQPGAQPPEPGATAPARPRRAQPRSR